MLVAFDAFFPEIGGDTIRVLHLANGDAIGWREYYCPVPTCDCRRLQLHATDLRTGQRHLVVSHGFNPFEVRPQWEDEQTYVEPLSELGPLADVLWKSFGEVMTPDYEARLKKHNQMIRDQIASDPRIDPGLDELELMDRIDELYLAPGRAARNPNRDVGRNDPCPCGSGKKFKRCCL